MLDEKTSPWGNVESGEEMRGGDEGSGWGCGQVLDKKFGFDSKFRR